MSEYSSANFICSTVGFDAAEWREQYYPEECPRDWQFAYYMNDFSSVYLPASRWLNSPQLIAEITVELDEDFDLVVELPPSSKQSISEHLAQLAPLKKNVCCLVIDPKGIPEGEVDQVLAHARKAYPLVLDSTESPHESMASLAQQHQIGMVWRPNIKGSTPMPDTDIAIIRTPLVSLRDLRVMFEKLRFFSDQDTCVRVFIEPAAQSAQRAMAAKELIELLAIA